MPERMRPFPQETVPYKHNRKSNQAFKTFPLQARQHGGRDAEKRIRGVAQYGLRRVQAEYGLGSRPYICHVFSTQIFLHTNLEQNGINVDKTPLNCSNSLQKFLHLTDFSPQI